MSANVEMNAVIDSVCIGLERGAFLTGWVQVNRADGFSQGFGGTVLGGVPSAKAGNHAEQQNIAAMWLVGVMLAADVEDFTKAVGKAVRIRCEPGFNGKIIAIGHIIKDDRWFCPDEAFAGARE